MLRIELDRQVERSIISWRRIFEQKSKVNCNLPNSNSNAKRLLGSSEASFFVSVSVGTAIFFAAYVTMLSCVRKTIKMTDTVQPVSVISGKKVLIGFIAPPADVAILA